MTITLEGPLEQRLKAAAGGSDPEKLAHLILSEALEKESVLTDDERARMHAGIQRGLDAEQAGRSRPAAEFYADLRGETP